MGRDFTGAEPPEMTVKPLPPLPEPDEPARRGHRTLVGAVAGLLIGMTLGALLARTEGAKTIETPVGRVPLLAPEEHTSGLAASVPGFAETLLVVSPNGMEAMDMFSWPPTGPLQRSALPASWTAITLAAGPFTAFAAIDPSGHQVALAAPVAREGSLVLLAGRPAAVVPVATGVTSYVWHDSEEHSLAYTVVEPDGAWLEVMRGSPRLVERVAPVDSAARLVGWADWGFALADGERLAIIGPDRIRELEGELLAVTSDRLLIEHNGTVAFVDPGDGSREEAGFAGGLRHADFDPSGSRLALVRTDGFEIVVEGATVFSTLWPFVEQLTWTADGRYLVFSDRVGVLVLDTDGFDITALGISRAIALATRPPELNSP